MSFLPSIRELQVRLARTEPEATQVVAELQHAATVVDRAAGDGDAFRRAAQVVAELLSTAAYLNAWVNQGAATTPPAPTPAQARAERPAPKNLRIGFASATPASLAAPRRSADLPVPPDLLTRAAMATACGISESYLAAQVAAGVIERPQRMNHRTYWPASAARAYVRKRQESGSGAKKAQAPQEAR